DSPPMTANAEASKTIRLGCVGVDSSHLPEFTKRIHALRDAGETGCTVTHSFDAGPHFLPESDVAEWTAATRGMGVEEAGSMDELLDAVDGVLVLSVNGHEHLGHALPALERGLPTYVDKPLTCDLAQAKQLRAAAKQSGARCYSASSLRFVSELETLGDLGDIVAVDVVGPGELNDAMEGLFFYGVHSIELVDALMGPGVEAVQATGGTDRDFVRFRYDDGRSASIRLERRGSYAFAATVHGTEHCKSFVVDFGPVYGRLVAGMCRFFEGGPAPVDLDRLIENIAVMEAGNRSMASDGEWVEVVSGKC
ncbi:MAG: Gfo/Idh/MocA family oxidoreductase, partial [Planctomycetota bacterium]